MPTANADAFGRRKEDLETPALCLDLERYQRNAARLAAFLKQHGVSWRPHMKGQKAPRLAQMAVAAGAIGVTCATVYEAEAMAAAGIASILIAHETVGAAKLRRLARLEHKTCVISATDSAEHLHMLADAARAERVIIPVIVELDVGMHRSGIQPGEPAVQLARLAASTEGIRLEGLMGWEGHVTQLQGAEKTRAAQQSLAALVETARLFREHGLSAEIVSCAGSGTFLESAQVTGITEAQAGGAVFSDLTYQSWGVDHEFALTVLARVASRPAPDRIIVDAGFKAMSTDHGLPLILELDGVKRLALSAEHATIVLNSPSPNPRVGDLVEFVPSYTDSTVCLHDEMVALRKGVVEEVWEIPGRSGGRGLRL
ncbi:MAG: alanine racemase [Candidatus Solibacter usitatus]|nr:alanine racemase [Candidatus Solibacter usitatus]